MELSKTASMQKIKYTVEFKIPHLQKLMGQWVNDQENNSSINAKIHKFEKPRKTYTEASVCQTEVSLPKSTDLGVKDMSSGVFGHLTEHQTSYFTCLGNHFHHHFFKAQYQIK